MKVSLLPHALLAVGGCTAIFAALAIWGSTHLAGFWYGFGAAALVFGGFLLLVEANEELRRIEHSCEADGEGCSTIR